MRKVFIGLPVYNGEAFLAEAIESVLSQTFTDFTLFISDNASTDGTEAIARRYAAADPRVVYHRHEKNLGAAPNFNYCVDRAEGVYFKWMAHDDRLAPDYLRACVEMLDRNPGTALCHAGVTCIDDSGEVTGDYDQERAFNEADPVSRFRRAIALDHGCVTVFGVMRLDLLKKTPRIAPFVGSDRPLLAEFALHGRLDYVPERLFFWREHKSRSVRMTRRDRVAWFDASARAIFATLYLRQMLAAQGAVRRAPLPIGTKVRATGATLAWGLRNRARLFQDLRAVIRIGLGSLAGKTRATAGG